MGRLVQVGAVHGGLHVHQAAHRLPVPRQLPPAPAAFVGREEELAALSRSVAGAAGQDLVRRNLGRACAQAGRHEEACQEALDRYRAQHRSAAAERLRGELGLLDRNP